MSMETTSLTFAEIAINTGRSKHKGFADANQRIQFFCEMKDDARIEMTSWIVSKVEFSVLALQA